MPVCTPLRDLFTPSPPNLGNLGSIYKLYSHQNDGTILDISCCRTTFKTREYLSVSNSKVANSDIGTVSLDEMEAKIPVRPSATVLKICPHNPTVSCTSCRLKELCLPIALNKSKIHQLDAIVERNRPFKKGDHLYRQSDVFKSVYAVRSGSFKSYFLSDSGQGRVTGFYLPGEIIGMDGIASRSYANSTSALEHSSICEIPFSQLEKLSQELPSLQHHFFSIMGNEIAKDQQIHTLLSSYTAEERTASFLLGLSSRYARVSLSPTRFLLPMTRGDIG